MAKKAVVKKTVEVDPMVENLREYVKVKEEIDRLKKIQDALKDMIKNSITKVNTELLYDDPEFERKFMAKLAITTRDSIDSKAVRELLTPEQLQSVTKTSSVETLTVKIVEAV